MSKVLGSPDSTISRRQLMWLTAMGTLGLGMGLKSAQAAEEQPEPDFQGQFEEIRHIVATLRDQEPGLTGFEQISPVAAFAFGDRTEEENRLLAGRLYYDSLERLRSLSSSDPAPDFSKDNVKKTLSGPLETGPLTQEYFDRLLIDTQTRAAEDETFRRNIDHAADWGTSAIFGCEECFIFGKPRACWKCILLAAAVIILIIGLLIAGI